MNQDFTCERGAKRNFEKWRDPTSKELQETPEERLDRLEREEAEAAEEAERNVMEELEQKREDSKREMQIANALDDIRMRNARIERGEKGGKEEQALTVAREEAERLRQQEEEELEQAARLAFSRNSVEKARLEEDREMNGDQDLVRKDPKVIPTFEKIVRPRKPGVNSLATRATSNVPSKGSDTAQKPTAPAGLGLGAYDSDSDD